MMMMSMMMIVSGFKAYMSYMHVEAAHTPCGDHLHLLDVAGPSEQEGQTAGPGGLPGAEQRPADGDDEEREECCA